MKGLAGALAGALGTLLGLQALRAFVTSLIWYIGEALSPNIMGAFSVGVLSMGLLSGVVLGRLGRGRAERWSAVGLALLYPLAVVIPFPLWRIGLAGGATVVWIWWFSAFAGSRRSLSVAVVGGLSLDVMLHAVLNGLDLHAAGLPGVVLGLSALYLTAALQPTSDGNEPGWGMLTLAPWLFLQLELLTNLGRIRQSTGLGPLGAALLAEAGLAVALLAMALPLPTGLRRALAILGSVYLLLPVGVPSVLAAQVGMGAAVAGSVKDGSSQVAFPFTVLLLGALLFSFYAQNTLPVLIPAAGILVLVNSLFTPEGPALTAPRRAIAMPLILALVTASLLWPGAEPVSRPLPARGSIAVMSYNIHQGLDHLARPSSDRIAQVIEAAAPDIAGLQEVNRGWTIAGASDLVTFLEHRLPQYHMAYAPMAGDLWGTAILSRYPIVAQGFHQFTGGGAKPIQGFSWAVLAIPGCDTLVINAHLLSGRNLDGERAAEMADVLRFWARRPCTILLGDLNAEPHSEAVKKMVTAGFTDWLGVAHTPRLATWPSQAPVESIDYVATTAEFQAVRAHTLATLASDHRPVLVEMRLSLP